MLRKFLHKNFLIGRKIIGRVSDFLVVLTYRLIFLFKKQKKTKARDRNFVFNKSTLHPSLRQPGISGFYRIKNEEELLGASLDSHIKYLDEIVIVYNDCNDRTPEIALQYAKKYPEKVKVVEYLPKVFPPFSKEHIGLSPSSPNSLVNYYNFALSQTTKKIVVKIDADHVAIENKFKQAVSKIHKEGLTTLCFFSGINLYKIHNTFYVNKNKPFTAGFDTSFFPVSKKTFFVHRRYWELLKIPLAMRCKRRDLGVLFYHLKGIKSDKGVRNYGINTEKGIVASKRVQNPVLISWEEAVSTYDCLKEVPDPNQLLKKML